MTATNEQIKAEAERRRLKQYKAYGGRLPDVGGSLIDHVIEVTREGWKPPEPVDPDLLAVRRLLAEEYPRLAKEMLAGERDHNTHNQRFLAGYKAGRAAR